MSVLTITVAAGSALAPMGSANATTTASTATATTAEAAAFCTSWALADRVDQRGSVYGGGGVRCKGETSGRLVVKLYRNNKKVASTTEKCPRNRYCSGSTGQKRNPKGNQEWCTRMQFHDIIGNDHYIKWDCMVS
ncbi:hypothetical protein E1295_14480 [Nonomuraea mesophila]|uniref:Secreted protein n=1 Tax=Nonomuraea mesophila TaxID=2530382 RepID=A0A4R5FPB5_9ACTN|nr:hypothetical protein [Nonomuraea mesophila]TDE54609.1 hypothetical protein E1295_14480 [Nonomuraea mesophila]